MRVRIAFFILLFVFGLVPARGQTSEIVITLNEQFFDTLLDAAFQNSAPPEFSLAKANVESSNPLISGFTPASFDATSANVCTESVKLLRENKNVRTGVRFSDGRITAPIAFTGNYSPPLIGCVQFSGSAQANITLEFDAEHRILRGNAKIVDVSLDGTGGLGGGIIARMVQGSIDRKINPIQIIDLDKLTFVLPIQNMGPITMKAVSLKSEVVGNALNVRIQVEFKKG